MLKPQFCIPIQACTRKELQRKLRLAQPKADILEVWLDYLDFELTPQELFSFIKKPLLLVNKLPQEGGKWHGRKKKQIEFLKKYLAVDPAYIDVSIDTPPELLQELIATKKRKTRLIFSYHHFSRTPPLKTLKKIVTKGFRLGADIVKIATFARTIQDNLIILNLLQQTKRPLIAHCMGPQGIISRLLAPRFGSGIVYVALDEKSKTAPGQMTISEFKKLSKKL